MLQANDADILDRAAHEGRTLITNDKNFGELVFRSKQPHHGVILLRLLSNLNVNPPPADTSPPVPISIKPPLPETWAVTVNTARSDSGGDLNRTRISHYPVIVVSYRLNFTPC
jgi:hypothetical protein